MIITPVLTETAKKSNVNYYYYYKYYYYYHSSGDTTRCYYTNDQHVQCQEILVDLFLWC